MEGFGFAGEMFGRRLSIFCTSPAPLSPEDGDRSDWMFCPTLLLAYLERRNGIIILPRDDRMVSLWDYHKARRGLEAWQVIWTRGNSYSLAGEAAANHVHEIKAAMGRFPGIPWQLVVYEASDADSWLADRLGGIPIVGDGPIAQRKWDKGRLHDHIDVGADPCRPSLATLGLPTPRGFCFSDHTGALKAREALRQMGANGRFIMKPVRNCGGWGIREIGVSSEVTEDDVKELSSLEEKVRGARDKDDRLITGSCHWGAKTPEGRFLGPLWMQAMRGVEHRGNMRPITIPSPFVWDDLEKQARGVTRQFLDLSGLEGPGGLDMVLDGNGHWRAVDPNIRPTYNFPCLLVGSEVGPGVAISSCLFKSSCTLEDNLEALRSRQLEYQTGGLGIYPFSVAADRNSACVVVGKSPEHAEHLREMCVSLAS